MKLNHQLLLAALALGLSTWTTSAQDTGNAAPRDERPPQREAGSPGRHGGQRPAMPPLFAALDLNRDGVLDTGEISKASESLKKLDKDGDGQITADEIRPQRPSGPSGTEGQPERRRQRSSGTADH